MVDMSELGNVILVVPWHFNLHSQNIYDLWLGSDPCSAFGSW